jgi:hypothetical protein
MRRLSTICRPNVPVIDSGLDSCIKNIGVFKSSGPQIASARRVRAPLPLKMDGSVFSSLTTNRRSDPQHSRTRTRQSSSRYPLQKKRLTMHTHSQPTSKLGSDAYDGRSLDSGTWSGQHCSPGFLNLDRRVLEFQRIDTQRCNSRAGGQ